MKHIIFLAESNDLRRMLEDCDWIKTGYTCSSVFVSYVVLF